MHTNIDKYIQQLKDLLPQLESGEILGIEFGHPEMELGPFSHHRFLLIDTPGGTQLCLKLVHRMSLGSGNYLGEFDRELAIQKAAEYLTTYFRPTPLGEKLKEMRAKNPDHPAHREPQYFAVKA